MPILALKMLILFPDGITYYRLGHLAVLVMFLSHSGLSRNLITAPKDDAFATNKYRRKAMIAEAYVST